MQFFPNGLVITFKGGFSIMNNIQGIQTIIYPVKDITQAKALFSTLLGVGPYMDEAYYVGFRVGDQDIGLDLQWPQPGYDRASRLLPRQRH